MSFSISPIQKRAWLRSLTFGVPSLIQCIIRIEGVLDQNYPITKLHNQIT